MPEITENQLVLYVNGKKLVERNADPEWTLIQYLRTKLRLTGTKLGCSEGGCGACTVMVSRYDHQNEKILNYSVNACLAPLCSMHGLAVTTVEGIGNTATRLHPVQKRLAESHGSQCGFCTPGIVMSMYTLLRNNPEPAMKEIEECFQGNLCRCTGYRPILDGFRTFSKEFTCGLGEACCRNVSNGAVNGHENKQVKGVTNGTNTPPSEFVPHDATQEPIFPSELQMSNKYDKETLTFQGERVTWIRPVTLEALMELKARYPGARLVGGNTEVGVEVKLKNQFYPILIAPTHVPQLNDIQLGEDGISIGASVSLSRLEEVLKEAIDEKPAYQTRIFVAIVEMLRWFAGYQIRNVAAIGGNIMTASPISDLNPLFMAAQAKLNVASRDGGFRTVPMDDQFFQGYRKTVLDSKEVLISIWIPFTKKNEYFFGYKQAHRRDDDIAIVNAGMRVEFEPGTNVIQDISLAYGGMAPTTVMARQTAKQLIGKHWEDDLVTEASSLLAEDLPLPPGAPGGMESYRRTLTLSFFYKFYLTVQLKLQESQPDVSTSQIPLVEHSATPVYQRDPSKGVQVFEEVTTTQEEAGAVGHPIKHLSAEKQVSGEAIYIDDIPHYEGELHLTLVTSRKAHANIVSMDASKALALPGVHCFLNYKDIPGKNESGPVIHDEEIFASEKVTCQGHIIGAVVADTQALAQRAAKLVHIEYEELPPIITIEQAIAAGSFHTKPLSLQSGDVQGALATSDHVIEGETRIGGQEHFYLETHATIAVPSGEDRELQIFSSTQNPTEVQMMAAKALDIPANRIVVRVKRMGGGFGGKETRIVLVSTPCALAAAKLKRPVRCILDREEDMVMTGTRHPFLGRYKVGFTAEGKITAADVELYSNAGNSLDLSRAVMERAIFHVDNCYKVPNLRVKGYICNTNIPSNTAFRGFGGPQGMMVTEAWISDIADTLGMLQEQVRDINMYQEGDLTHFNQKLDNCHIRKCWEQCIETSSVETRRQEVKQFNRENRWKKRGISVVPTKFGISFTVKFLNQAGALVHVYTDGTVLLSHAGTEMGQGLHTKMVQVASRVLKIPTSKIHISETSTQCVPNTSATAASVSSDINGMAVMYACQTIMERLKPVINDNPKGSWEEWVKAAYFQRISLSSTGFYKTPDIGYNWETNTGNPFSYFTFGAACSEVEIDCLTGDHTVLRTDIVMDVGNSLNPAIDIGQIEGGFIQGYGLMTLEEQRYSPDGFLFTRGPGMYKIPGFSDIPVEFNVSLLKGCPNQKAVYSSKAIGEPPFFLAASVFHGIRNAIAAAREDAGITEPFHLDSPATAEKIRMHCVDQFTKKFPAPEQGTFKPWFVNL